MGWTDRINAQHSSQSVQRNCIKGNSLFLTLDRTFLVMTHEILASPRQFHGVMVSSTFTDLEQHRAALIKAIKGQGLADVAMENDSAKPDVDVIESSIQMVRDASAYIGVISRKYGQVPLCPNRNPDKLSLTELEFNEAQKLGRPILLFIMGDKHPLREVDVESKAVNRKKLNAFRERAKRMKRDSTVHRVYATFDNLEEFTSMAIQSVAGLRRRLDEKDVNRRESRLVESLVGKELPLTVLKDIHVAVPTLCIVGRQSAGKTTLKQAIPNLSADLVRTQIISAFIVPLAINPIQYVAILDGNGSIYSQQFKIAKRTDMICVVLDHNELSTDSAVDDIRLDSQVELLLQLRHFFEQFRTSRASRIHFLLNKRDLWQTADQASQTKLRAFVTAEAEKWKDGRWANEVSMSEHSKQ